MVIAVAVVRMMEVAVDQVVDVIAVRHRLVAAAGAVLMLGVVSAAAVIWSALGWVGVADLDRMLIDVVVVRTVEVPVVEIVDMTGMHDRGVPTARPVGMVVALMYLVSLHDSSRSAGSGLTLLVSALRLMQRGRGRTVAQRCSPRVRGDERRRGS